VGKGNLSEQTNERWKVMIDEKRRSDKGTTELMEGRTREEEIRGRYE
jgi:hypothetical protein